MFGDNLQTQLNDIRASNKISKSTLSLSGIKNPDHKAVLGLGAPAPSTLKENKEGAFFIQQPAVEALSPKNNFPSQEAPNSQAPAEQITATKEITGKVLENLQVSNLEKDLPLVVEYLNNRADSFKQVK